MNSILFTVNDASYGSERAYNPLRLAGALVARGKANGTLEADKVLVF